MTSSASSGNVSHFPRELGARLVPSRSEPRANAIHRLWASDFVYVLRNGFLAGPVTLDSRGLIP
jgi:hypothetical protein